MIFFGNFLVNNEAGAPGQVTHQITFHALVSSAHGQWYQVLIIVNID
jgi:hypothetical protein